MTELINVPHPNKEELKGLKSLGLEYIQKGGRVVISDAMEVYNLYEGDYVQLYIQLPEPIKEHPILKPKQEPNGEFRL
jgi:hypothetical protein